MDRAVLDAYGWHDIRDRLRRSFSTTKVDEEEWGRRKKPWRYRWPNDVHDEILARLLELNAERAREEVLSGNPVGGKKEEDSARLRAETQEGLF